MKEHTKLNVSGLSQTRRERNLSGEEGGHNLPKQMKHELADMFCLLREKDKKLMKCHCDR